MLARLLPFPVAAAVALGALAVPVASPAAPPPPDRPARGEKSTWTEADKAGFGTARTRRSRVWFTLQRGRVSEVFAPDLSTPSVRNLELVVTDGRTFTDRESTDMTHATSRPDELSLRFRQVNTDEDGRYRLVKDVVTDPRRDALRVRVRLESLDGAAYQLWVVHDPALDNGGMDDRGRTVGGDRRGRALVAHDAGAERGGVATALVARPGLGPTSNAVAGPRDGWRDLRADHRLDRRPVALRRAGNLVQVGRVAGVDGRGERQRAVLTLGFGTDEADARRAARTSRREAWAATAERYDRQWHRYLAGLRGPGGVPAAAETVRRTYLSSALVLAAAEDKAHPGAIIASPSAPWVWGDEVPDLSSPSGAYHLVWARDAYEFGTALWAMGDRRAARRVVDWLFEVQQRPDGSFPQNSTVDGEPVWDELQLDEVALPIVLARLTGRTGPRAWAGVRRAADFVAGFRDPETGRRAPYSPQERWENQAGYSPNTIAGLVAGMVAAADIARQNGARADARRYLRLADAWQARLKRLTVTRNGPLADTAYFLRLSKDGHPSRGTRYAIGDGGPAAVDQRRVVDPSFLTLTRLGVLPADDPVVASTLRVVDRELRVETPNGPFWRRFSFDGYGETRSGGQWRITEDGSRETLGRAWPLLTGERGEHEVAAGRDGTAYLATIAAAAGAGDVISEQVWDGRAPTGRPCCPAGEGTRAATPLVWSHAALVRLAWTIQQGRPVDQQEVVARRYAR
ncbi:glycoside hydrolase family 15 protein [Nocardioides deserti]|nr:glycoside hydrolase family 15 protein [Nocardioides deserti]GGO72086.1 glucan 1,4-alpha-glucosidase [Nocardioides deserti]